MRRIDHVDSGLVMCPYRQFACEEITCLALVVPLKVYLTIVQYGIYCLGADILPRGRGKILANIASHT